MRKSILAVVFLVLMAVLILAFSSSPSVTLTVRVLTNDSLVAQMYPGSNFQAVAAIVEMKNNTKRKFLYAAYYPCPRIPYFRCRYREAGVWKDEAMDTAGTRAFAECPATITGQPWGLWILDPGEIVVFRADVLRPRAECRVVVDYWEQTRRKRWYDRLPTWIVKKLPWAEDRFQAETLSIANASDN
jgi:hypothetical protein